MKLKYYVEFTELIDKNGVNNMNEKELEEWSEKTKSHIKNLLEIGGVNIHGELKVEFDFEE